MKSGLEIEVKEQFLIALGWFRGSSGLCLISNGSVKKFREQSGLGGVYGDLLYLSLINRLVFSKFMDQSCDACMFLK